MYKTCLFCNRDMGVNEVIETLPIGRRIAFDPAKGRLWVVCRGCERWNLVPFDTRLETIETAERLFRNTHTRFSTDNIGLARTGEGLELVRIGPALRPEFASWRYGDQFGRRMRRMYVLAGASLAVSLTLTGAVLTFGSAAAPIIPFGWLLAQAPLALQANAGRKVLRNLPALKRQLGAGASLTAAFPWLQYTADGEIELQFSRVAVRRPWSPKTAPPASVGFRGEEMRRILRHVLPVTNMQGGSKAAVRQAVSMSDGKSFGELLTGGSKNLWHYDKNRQRMINLFEMRPDSRLALEMLLHEENERTALEADLKLLEREWRDAEEIAAISDNLALGHSASTTLEPGKDPVA